MSRTPTPSGHETLSQLMDGEWQDVDRSACVAGICDDPEARARWARWHLVRDLLKSGSPLAGPIDGPLVADAADLSLCDRIRGAIDDEPAYSNVVGFANGSAAPQRAVINTATAAVASGSPIADAPIAAAAVSPVRPGLRQGAVGFALAAGVAVATVTGLTVWQGAGEVGGEGVAPIASSAPSAVGAGGTVDAPASRLPAVELVGNTGSYWVSDNAESADGRSAAEARLNRFLSQHLEQAPSASREGLLPYSRLVGYDERSVAGGR